MKTPPTRSLSSRILSVLFAALLWPLAWSAAAEVNLLAFGDWGQQTLEQEAVARQIATYATTSKVRFDAALLLGDNYYGKMPGGVSDPRWQTEFEQAYDPAALPMPFYAALGNHDYEADKAEAQLQYGRRHPQSRWKMPARWYRVDLPADQPLVTILVLDSNVSKLSKQDWKAQLKWLDGQLARPTNGPWTIAAAHHPLFTAGQHGDTKTLVDEWGPVFTRRGLDFFLCGHDHDLQHLQMESWPTTFILAGGGGAKIRPMKRDDRGPFSRSLHGFFHLQLTPGRAAGRFISMRGEVVHHFARSAAGQVEVVMTTGRDKPAPASSKGGD